MYFRHWTNEIDQHLRGGAGDTSQQTYDLIILDQKNLRISQLNFNKYNIENKSVKTKEFVIRFQSE